MEPVEDDELRQAILAIRFPALFVGGTGILLAVLCTLIGAFVASLGIGPQDPDEPLTGLVPVGIIIVLGAAVGGLPWVTLLRVGLAGMASRADGSQVRAAAELHLRFWNQLAGLLILGLVGSMLLWLLAERGFL